MTWTGTVYRGRKPSDQRVRIDLEGAKLTVAWANETRSWDLAVAAVTRRHWGLTGGTVLQISGATGELTLGAAGYTDPARAYASGTAAPQIGLAASDFRAFEATLAEAGVADTLPAGMFTLWRNLQRPRWAYLPSSLGALMVGLLGVASNLSVLSLSILVVAVLVGAFALLARYLWRLIKQPALSIAVRGDEIVVERLLPPGPAVHVLRTQVEVEHFRWQPPTGRWGGSTWDFPAVSLRLTGDFTVSVGAAAVSPQTSGPKHGAPAYLINPAWYAELIAAVAGQARVH